MTSKVTSDLNSNFIIAEELKRIYNDETTVRSDFQNNLENDVKTKTEIDDENCFREVIELNSINITTKTYSREEISYHSCSQSCWIVIGQKVYDVTNFILEHPGGAELIQEYGGWDATCAFTEAGHSVDALRTLERYCIGVVKED